LVSIPDFPPRTTPVASAAREWKTGAIWLRRGLLSFIALLFLALPRSNVNEGRDRADEKRQECGFLKLDFSDPCNAITLAVLP
jgi:hypothetical protein